MLARIIHGTCEQFKKNIVRKQQGSFAEVRYPLDDLACCPWCLAWHPGAGTRDAIYPCHWASATLLAVHDQYRPTA